jgi:basic membrane protein A and related proteins
MNRRHFLALSLSGALIATGGSCGKKQETPTLPPSGEGKKIKAGLVTDTGGVGDKSFNAQAWAGLQKAEKELGAQVKYVESKQNADYVANLTKFAEAKYDVIFAVGFLMQDALKEVAFKFPKVKFAIIDGDAPSSSNCVAYKFREEEGSFLAGALAASVSKSGVLGFVGGMEMPLIKKF